MSEKITLRWKTEGTLTEPLLREATLLACKPRYARVTERIAQIIMAICLVLMIVCGFATGEWQYLLQLTLVTVLYGFFTWGICKWAVHMSMKAFREQNAGGSCPYATAFTETGVYVHNGGNDAKAVIAYEHFSRLCQADETWVLLTKMKAIVPVFQAQLTDGERSELLAHLKTVCPKLKNELKQS